MKGEWRKEEVRERKSESTLRKRMCQEKVEKREKEKREGKLCDKRQHLSPRLAWCEGELLSKKEDRQEEKTEKVVYERIEGVGLVIQRKSSGKKKKE